ncbi:MAG TPA: hypothetical protein PL005_09195 [Candidatus Hydrogenedentes bacterium]|nr:hypothetical protein [Candidatus Hydrogenedentota bacterium]
MKAADHREQTVRIVRDFYETLLCGGGKPMDFFELLWVVDGAVEAAGADTVRQVLGEFISDPGEYDTLADRLLERLTEATVESKLNDNELAAWFQRAIQ